MAQEVKVLPIHQSRKPIKAPVGVVRLGACRIGVARAHGGQKLLQSLRCRDGVVVQDPDVREIRKRAQRGFFRAAKPAAAAEVVAWIFVDGGEWRGGELGACLGASRVVADGHSVQRGAARGERTNEAPEFLRPAESGGDGNDPVHTRAVVRGRVATTSPAIKP